MLERIGELLLADEARHNLAFGISRDRAVAPGGVSRARRLGRSRRQPTSSAARLRTPPHNLVVAKPAAPAAVESPGGLGRGRAARRGRRRAGGGRLRRGLAQATRRSAPTSCSTSGSMRSARSFRAPPGAGRAPPRGPGRPRARHRVGRERSPTRRSVAATTTHEWSEASTRASTRATPASGSGRSTAARCLLAGFGGPTPNGIRIGPVYTPPELRGHGYGTAVTAAVSRLLLDRGHQFCFLYTDLANPTSNAIYMRIGYEPVCDSREVMFASPSRIPHTRNPAA